MISFTQFPWAYPVVSWSPRRFAIATTMIVPSVSSSHPHHRPFERQLLAEIELGPRHLGGDGIAKSQEVVAIVGRTMSGRQIQPFVGLHDVAGDAEALIIHQAEQILSGGVA